MPATEETRYNMRRLHKVFAVSSVLLTLATVWMFVRDHNREWKTIQRKNDQIEVRLAEWQQLQTLSDDAVTERERLGQSLAELLSKPFSMTLVDRLQAEVRTDARRRDDSDPNFEQLDAALDQVAQAAAAALVTRIAWQEQQLAADKARLEAEDAAVKASEAEGDAASELKETAEQLAAVRTQSQQALEKAARELHDAQDKVVPLRQTVLSQLNAYVEQARFREGEQTRLRKAELSELDVDKARLGFALRDDLGDAALKELQDGIERRQQRIETLTHAADEAIGHKERLRDLCSALTQEETALRKRLDENQGESKRLEQLLAEKRSTYFRFWGIVPLPGKKWLELPFLDAFNSPRKIENLWSEGLDRPAGSFGRVTRFDRCTTCHQGIQKSLADAPAQPALADATWIEFALLVPETADREADAGASGSGISHEEATTESDRIRSVFGIVLADEGLLDPDDVTIQHVDPAGLGRAVRRWGKVGRTERAGTIREQMMLTDTGEDHDFVAPGFLVGDVITAIDEEPVPQGAEGREWVSERLLAAWQGAGEATDSLLRVRVRRGLQHPFSGHPRLDLFVGEKSPHSMVKFGCTVCHEGQGSATEFKWASHTPDDVPTRGRWREQFGWFDNPHWVYPMHPTRFVESSCLKCHHDVVELERSDRFPDAPAPTVAKGYRLIRSLGCFGCHEIDGYAGAQQRIGPDLRLEPSYAAAAQQFQGAGGTGYDTLTETERAAVERLIERPEDDAARKTVLSMLSDDAHLGARRANSEASGVTSAATELATAPTGAAENESSATRFSPYVHRTLLPLLQDQESPGRLRRVGPSLRFVDQKLDRTYLSDWIREPRRLRPTTRMPHTFGLWRHLPAEQLRTRRTLLMKELAAEGEEWLDRPIRSAEQVQADLDAVEAELARVDEVEKRFEPMAVFAMVHYLQDRSQAYDYVQPPAGITPIVTDKEKEEQRVRGKVAFQELGCLACHDHSDFPEIARYRDSDFVVEGPDLTDLPAKFDAARNPHGAEWLYSWIVRPTAYSPRTTMPELLLEPFEHRDDDGKVTATTDTVADIAAYLLSGSAGDWQPAEDVVEQLDLQQEQVLEELTLTFLKDMFPTALAEQYLRQGIPDSQRARVRGAERELLVTATERGSLAPEQMVAKRLSYVAQKSFAAGGCFACHDIPGMEDAKPIGPDLNDWGRKDTGLLAFGHVAGYVQQNRAQHLADAEVGGNSEHSRTDGQEREADTEEFAEYFLQQLEAHNRVGFIHQKLSEPRSFDYHEARNKKYTERLQMPQFSLTAAEREAIMTFVLGLVADPPQDSYVYAPDEPTQAILAGTEVLTKYSCRGCHVVEAEKWQIAFEPDQYGEPLESTTYPFVTTPFSSKQLAQSRRKDRRGLRHAELIGMPALSGDALPLIFDDEEFPIEEEADESFELDRLIYAMQLWEPTVIDGFPYQTGDGTLDVFAEHLVRRRRSHGGALTKYLLPRVVARELEENPNAKGAEAWGWLPPVLVGEGRKVQPDWLHSYLLNPEPIRPAMIMQMPRFNMSSRESAQLVDYFAAKDQVDYPYELEPIRETDHLQVADQQYVDRLERLAAEEGSEIADLSHGRHLRDAMRIVTDTNYCVKCHLVGDFDPPGIDRVKAPDLAAVHRRLRGEYVRRWLAKPNSIQPYTPMPVNIPFDPAAPLQGSTLPQELYHGSSQQQIDALADLLLNYDRFSQQRAPVAPLLEK